MAVFINGGSDYIRRAVRAVSGEKVRQECRAHGNNSNNAYADNAFG